MDNYSAQNSITVKRLRTGDTLFISLLNNGVPLYQGVDPASGTVSPVWGPGQSDIHPILTPQVTSALGNAVSLRNHAWTYNNTSLSFTGSTITIDNVTYTKASNDARFAMATNGALAIIGNLASSSNPSSDSLTYSCIAIVLNVEYPLDKSVDIQIQVAGSNTYSGILSATTEQLTAVVTQATISAILYSKGTVLPTTDYYVVWYKDETIWEGKQGSSSIIVTRNDIEGTQLIVAEFYTSQTAYNNGSGTPIFKAGIRIIDSNDQFHVQHRYCYSDGSYGTGNPNSEVDTGKPVYVQAYVVNTRTNSELTTITSAHWVSMIMNPNDWSVIKRIPAIDANPNYAIGASQTISITTAETDADGVKRDVEVISEVEWEM